MSDAKTVTTVRGSRYVLDRELGRGGQGAVFAVRGGRLAVKLVFDKGPRAQERLRDQLAMVGRLPLEGLAVARPLEQLRPPDTGYLMELITGMTPLRSLARPTKDAASVSAWYMAGGGLRRRLRVLARTAEIFADLHGRGLTYVDPSPHNVFVSEDADETEVRLIDTDNLRPSSSSARCVFTPAYGAPEIVRRSGVPSSLSDAHAFAVLAFEALALTHPLLGDDVQDGDPELENAALAGHLPWIDDPNDGRNRSSNGIPRDIVLSSALREDFQETFGPGLAEPSARPGLPRWAEHLHRAADRTLRCPCCDATYYCDRDACPWCDAPRPAFVMAAVLLWDPKRLQLGGGGAIKDAPGLVRDPKGKPRVLDAVALSLGDSLVLTSRITHGTTASQPRLRLKYEDSRLSIAAIDEGEARLVAADGRRTQRLSERPVDVAIADTGANWQVHFGGPEDLHRVLRFDFRPGAQQ